MKDKLKGLFLGLLIGTIITGGTVFAANRVKIEVAYENLKYMVDGVEKRPSTGKGFIYDGTTYVPLRFAGEAIGKDVSWDGKTKTVWIGKKEGTFKYLPDLEYARADLEGTILHFNEWKEVGIFPNKYSDGFSISGNEYLHGIGIENMAIFSNEGSGTVSYNLNNDYTTFTGYLGIDDHSKNSANPSKVIIIGDDQVLYESKELKGGDLPIKFEVDLTGVNRLEIKISTTGEDYKSNNLIVIGEPMLYQ